VRDVNGQEIKLSFIGKMKDADTIDGKIKVNFNGEDREVDWKPMRAKA
jgi:hypothetical protein